MFSACSFGYAIMVYGWLVKLLKFFVPGFDDVCVFDVEFFHNKLGLFIFFKLRYTVVFVSQGTVSIVVKIKES